MNPLNLFKFLEKEKGIPVPLRIKLVMGLPLTPDELNVKGDLYLRDSKITSLPQGLKVKGYLSLYRSKITSLPKNLETEGLRLTGTPIASLPSGLKINGSLNISFTKISTLPPDLKVEETVWINGTPLSKKSDEEIRAMLTTGYIKGMIVNSKL